jgi:hypothetical protein
MLVNAPPPVTDPAQNRENIQAAIDRAGSDGLGLVRFPAGAWEVDGPLFLDRVPNSFASVGLRGEGAGISRITMKRGLNYDVLVIGCDRRPRHPGAPAGAALTPDHFTPTDGLLDATAPGRWAYRSRGDTHLAAQGTALDQGLGDWYGKTRCLAIDAAIVLNDDRSGDAALFGLADGMDNSPWSLALVRGIPYFSVTMRGSDGSDPESRSTRRYFLGTPLAPGLHRIAIQLDLGPLVTVATAPRAPFVTCWVDGVRVPVTQQQGTAPGPGESFYPNQHGCFGVGSRHGASAGVTDGYGSARDVTFAGLKLTASALYDPSKDGPVRIDGQPLTDLLRYFSWEPSLVGYLALDDSPASAAKDRTLAVVQDWAAGLGSPSRAGIYCLDNAGHVSPSSSYTPGPIRDISIECGGGMYGRAVALGMTNRTSIRDCRLLGGSHGLGAISLGATYPVYLDDCTLQGNDAPLYLHMASSVSARRLVFEGTYRAGVRLYYSGLVLDGLFAPHWGFPEYGVCARNSSISLRNVALDNETPGQGSQVADVYVTPIPGQPVSLCEIDTFDGVGSGPRSSKILLGGPPAGDSARTLIFGPTVRVRSLAVHASVPFRSVVRCLVPGLWVDGGVTTNRAGAGAALDFEGPGLVRPSATNAGPPVPANTGNK